MRALNVDMQGSHCRTGDGVCLKRATVRPACKACTPIIDNRLPSGRWIPRICDASKLQRSRAKKPFSDAPPNDTVVMGIMNAFQIQDRYACRPAVTAGDAKESVCQISFCQAMNRPESIIVDSLVRESENQESNVRASGPKPPESVSRAVPIAAVGRSTSRTREAVVQ